MGDYDDVHAPAPTTSKVLAERSGRIPDSTLGAGNCLFNSVNSEAVRCFFLKGRGSPRNMRRAVAALAATPVMQAVMTDDLTHSWQRYNNDVQGYVPRQPNLYPDYIREDGVWGNRFDVALLAAHLEDLKFLDARWSGCTDDRPRQI